MRSKWSALCLFILLSLGLSPVAQALDYPTRPVRIVVQVAAGSSIDISARIIAGYLTRAWGQQVVVFNKPGASGGLAVSTTNTAEPDGYTLLMAASSIFVVLPQLQTKIDISKLEPIGFISEQPMVFATPPNSPFKSIPQLVAYSKTRQGGINVGVITHGGLSHLAAEWFRSRSGASMSFIYYPGTQQALNDVIAGRIDMMVETLSGMLGSIKGKKINMLAVASTSRLPDFPGTPTVAETIPGFAASGWTALVATPGTPKSITQKVSEDLRKIVTNPDVVKRFATFGSFTRTMTPQELAAFIHRQQQQWKPIVDQVGIKQQ
jgi:tripartite-type tricarboxylate transporter receptor subunit TctC